MGIMAGTVRRRRRTRIRKESEGDDARRNAGLRSVGTGDHQHRRVRYFRLQLHEAENEPRLALLWRLHGLYRRVVHRDVRLSAHDLSAFGMAYAHLSGRRSVLA